MTDDDFAGRANAAEMLKDSDRLFKAIVTTSQEWIWSIDIAGKHIFSNPAVEKILGRRPEEITGSAWHQMVHPEDVAKVKDALSKSMAQRTGWRNLVLRWRHKDGTFRWLESNAVAVLDDAGRVIGFHGSDRDITDRTRSEEDLQSNEARFRLMFQNAPMPYQSLDEEGRFIDVNQAFLDTLGYRREELIGKYFGDILHPDWVDHFKTNFPRFKAVGEVLGVEFEMVKKDGGTILVYFNGKIQRDVIGRFERTHCIFQDITERRRAEAGLKQAEARHAKMIANIGDVIVIIDQEGINRYKSPNIAKWFGWQPEELIGRPALENVHPDDIQRATDSLGQLFQAPNRTLTDQFRYRCKDGHYKWIEFTGTNLLHDPDIQGVLGNYHDITERKQAEVEREKLETQMRHSQKMESVGRLAGGVAHDFNNMLGVILGHTEMALEQVAPSQPVYDDLQEIGKAARRSADLTRQLLAFARKQTVAPKVLDLNRTVEGMLKMLRRLIGEEVELAWHPGARLWPVKVDTTQIDQILANLCVNARDAIDGAGTIVIGTENATVETTVSDEPDAPPPGDFVRLTVQDDGAGMDEATIEHLFEPFYTTKPIGQGTGLGLATVYGIVKQNGGFIRVQSRPGEGTTFSLHFPRHHEAANHSLPSEPPPRPASGRDTILLVEDEPSILHMITQILHRKGYRVLAAAGPDRALELARTHEGPIHLLMTDVVMPAMNGRELATQVRLLHPAIRCLFMSGYTADVIAKHGVLEEGVHFIQKPFSVNALALKVRACLETA
ncbi:hybrid sensor histidine kinase/response regulator [Desulfatitalea alkaliphila]|uniref:histidine kinase n=1 Tax=Desulfatitalea alkaliphila TaxID=2929485 RepID=A0AA41R3M3_9BACT|nr:PAS domain-containing sensor histidine kinase [Desulfatitalea alkaliphila]MCJ8501036.1 PAS domain S-box protein [Desulfatitalea alkaliphila]